MVVNADFKVEYVALVTHGKLGIGEIDRADINSEIEF